jgi:hypothetical protein
MLTSSTLQSLKNSNPGSPKGSAEDIDCKIFVFGWNDPRWIRSVSLEKRDAS